MHENSFIEAKLHVAGNTSAPVQSRLRAIETALTPRRGETPAASVSAADKTEFWRELQTWCAQNIAAIEGSATGATG